MEEDQFQESYDSILLQISLSNTLSSQLRIVQNVSEISYNQLIVEFYHQTDVQMNEGFYYNHSKQFYSLMTEKKKDPLFEFTVCYPDLFQLESVSQRIQQIQSINPTFIISKIFTDKNLAQRFPNNVNNIHVQQIIDKDIDNKLQENENQLNCFSLQRTGLGGSFDYLHNGHKLLLLKQFLLTNKNCLIGITGEELLKNKKGKEFLQNYSTRKMFVQQYNLIVANKNLDLHQIQDPNGPMITGFFDGLIISPETRKGADFLNNSRKDLGETIIPIFEIDIIGGQDIQDKLSSSFVRNYLIAKNELNEEQIIYLNKNWTGLFEKNELQQEYPEVYLDQIKKRYSEPQRSYHTLHHIYDMLTLLDQYKDKIKSYRPVALSIWFHDVIYFPQQKDNERQSIVFFKQFCSKIQDQFDQKLIDTVDKFILQTEHHGACPQNAEQDLKYFLDIDLEILGSDFDSRYKKYSKSIQYEYSHFDEADFREGRSQFMLHFLSSQKNLYFTDLFKQKYEAIARQNIQKEIQMLMNIQKL